MPVGRNDPTPTVLSRGEAGVLCRESLDQPIMGQLRSSVILVLKTNQTTFQIHYIALSANVIFRLTLGVEGWQFCTARPPAFAIWLERLP